SIRRTIAAPKAPPSMSWSRQECIRSAGSPRSRPDSCGIFARPGDRQNSHFAAIDRHARRLAAPSRLMAHMADAAIAAVPTQWPHAELFLAIDPMNVGPMSQQAQPGLD